MPVKLPEKKKKNTCCSSFLTCCLPVVSAHMASVFVESVPIEYVSFNFFSLNIVLNQYIIAFSMHNPY